MDSTTTTRTGEQCFRSLDWMHEIRDAELEADERFMGWAMMSFADKDGKLFATVPQLAVKLGVSESTAKRLRARLVSLGWTKLAKKGSGGGRGKPGRGSVYQLTFPAALDSVSPVEALGSTKPGLSGSDDSPLTGSGVTHQERHEERRTTTPSGRGSEVDATTLEHQGLTNAGPGSTHSPVALLNDSPDRELAARTVAARIEQVAGEEIRTGDVYTAALENPDGVLRVWDETGEIALLVDRLRKGAHYPACVYGAHRAADVRDRPELGGMRLCDAHAATFNTQPLPQGAAA